MSEVTGPPDDRSSARDGVLTRRSFFKGAGVVAAGSLVGEAVHAAHASIANAPTLLAGEIEIELTINGAPQKVRVEPRTTLLNALRNHCQPPLTGAKLVCDQGTCGACTVHLEGQPVYSCLTLAVDAVGKRVTTIEGIAPAGELNAVQKAFCEHDASMCGFCTPGFVMSITACLDKRPDATLEEIQHACAGNLCRCGTYPHVFQAALAAGRAVRAKGATK